MSSREEILQNIRKNTQVRYEKPDLTVLESEALKYSDPISQFCKMMSMVGGQAVVLAPGQNINDVIRSCYPEAKRIASVMDEIQCADGVQKIDCATFHPDDVASSAELDGTDLAIVDGKVGVCENGAVWLQQDVEQRAVYFIAESLVIVLDRKNLVNNMHEAYHRVDTGKYGYGVFVSGPSKTADIEQALVMGAHGARMVTVILV